MPCAPAVPGGPSVPAGPTVPYKDNKNININGVIKTKELTICSNHNVANRFIKNTLGFM